MKISFKNSPDSDYQKLFDELIRSVFGFSFAPWFELKLWDESYESYSIIDQGNWGGDSAPARPAGRDKGGLDIKTSARPKLFIDHCGFGGVLPRLGRRGGRAESGSGWARMLANICLKKCDLVIDGQPLTAYQLGAVAVRAGYRGRGLARRLVEHILTRHPQSPLFLFGNESVVDFYPRFGFRRVFESRPFIDRQTGSAPGRAVKVSPAAPLVEHYLNNGRQASPGFYCANGRPVERFHLLLSYADDIYHLPDHDALVIAREEEKDIFIPYLNAPETADYVRLFEALPFPGKRLKLGFAPAQNLGIRRWETDRGNTEPMFVRGDFPLPELFTFPALAKT